jgi:hypothetical protein
VEEAAGKIVREGRAQPSGEGVESQQAAEKYDKTKKKLPSEALHSSG